MDNSIVAYFFGPPCTALPDDWSSVPVRKRDSV